MDAYLVRAIDEHKELTARINKLASFITACNVDRVKGECKVDVDDYVLMRIQLEHMINYHDVLESRLNKHGIIVEGEKYYEDVTNPIPVQPTDSESDFDKKKKKHGESEN